MMAALNVQSLALFSSERLLNCMVEGSGLALLGWILLRILGRRNSGTRFAVWFLALLLIAAFPVFVSWCAGADRNRVREAADSASCVGTAGTFPGGLECDCVARIGSLGALGRLDESGPENLGSAVVLSSGGVVD